MKTNYSILFPALALALVLGSCSKDSTAPVPTVSETIKQIRADLASAPEVFSKDITSGAGFTTAAGFRFYIPSVGLVDAQGVPATGMVEFKINAMPYIREMILNNCPTMGPDGIFISGGEFFISASANGKPLTIDPKQGVIRVWVPSREFNEITMNGYGIWNGIRSGPMTGRSDSTLTWTPVDTTGLSISNLSNSVFMNNLLQPFTDSTYQFFSLSKFGTINLDYYYHQNVPKTGVSIKVPSGYTNDNTVVYLAFPAINSVATLYDFDAKKNAFNLGSYQIPIGLDASVVVISKLGDQYKYTIKPFTVTENAVVDVVPVNTTLEELKTQLGEL